MRKEELTHQLINYMDVYGIKIYLVLNLCLELGIKYLGMGKSLVKDEQYVVVKKSLEYSKLTERLVNTVECLFLYNWWTKVRFEN